MKKLLPILTITTLALTGCGGSSNDAAEETTQAVETITTSESSSSKEVDAMPWLESQFGMTPGEAITTDPTSWYGYVSDAYREGSRLHVLLQVDRKADKALGQEAARAVSNFVMLSDDSVVDGVDWAIAEDGAGVYIAQEQVR